MDLVANYIKSYMETNLQNNLFNPFDNDIISAMEVTSMDKASIKGKSEQVLLTVISLDDNKNINLSVAQPNYMISNTSMGTGILAYKSDALNILKRDLKQNEIIIEIHISVDANEILDLCTYRHKEYLKKVHKTANKQFISDNEFMDYVHKKGNKKYKLVVGIVAQGKVIFAGSSIPEYINRGFLIIDESIIQSVKAKD